MASAFEGEKIDGEGLFADFGVRSLIGVGDHSSHDLLPCRIAERVQILGGTLAIDSSPGQGSTLTIEVPLPSHAYDAGRNNGSNRR